MAYATIAGIGHYVPAECVTNAELERRLGEPFHDWLVQNVGIDEYNLSLFGSVNDAGGYVTAYLGQLQATRDLRALHPIPLRTAAAWATVDSDEERWFPWIEDKLVFNPFNPFIAGGTLDDSDHKRCRTAAFDPKATTCAVNHAYNVDSNA